MMKSMAVIRIITGSSVFKIVIPNKEMEGATELIEDARIKAIALNQINESNRYHIPVHFLFQFENEMLEIDQPASSVHVFVKQENHPFDTPTIDVHSR